MNIGVIGCGFVGLANATLLAENNDVYLWDICPEKLEMISRQILPFDDFSLAEAWKKRKYAFNICRSELELVEHSEIILLTLPTNKKQNTDELDTECLHECIARIIEMKRDICIVIRSTVDVGFTETMKGELGFSRVVFMPEFLREGMAYTDMIFPDRIVIGGDRECVRQIIDMYVKAICLSGGKSNIPIMTLSTSEAEAIKLFSNTYLAMRIAFFNEIDTFAEKKELDTNGIIDGICLDHRIGDQYNNPSFGFGGYCLPKDVLQTADLLKADGVLIRSITESNEQRKNYIRGKIQTFEGTIGIYRLQAKKESSNVRYSVMKEICEELAMGEQTIYLYEPLISEMQNDQVILVDSVEELADKSTLIVSNYMDEELIPYKNKVYTRDKKARKIEKI